MSFASEPGRDDSSLPPLNVVIPDDARELDRDVLAYRRELRVRRRRARLLRLLRPVTQAGGPGGHVTLVPLIALCLMLTLVGGALLSVVTIGPVTPALNGSQASAPAAAPPQVTALPAGKLQVGGHIVQVRSLVSSAIALVPANCDCGLELQRLASQATAAGVGLYFVGTGETSAQLDTLTARYGDGTALPATDPDGVLAAAYHPTGLTVLLVFRDATAEVRRNLPVNFELGPVLGKLKAASGQSSTGRQPAA